MSFKVFGAEPAERPPVNLKLIPSGPKCDGVKLVAVDHNGIVIPAGNLLEIRADGQLRLFQRVNTDLGFKLKAGGVLDVQEVM